MTEPPFENVAVGTPPPSFQGLRPASALASKVKSRNRATDTSHEVLLRKALWKAGLRYRKNVRTLAGKPDIVFHRQKVAIFCDGDFWHGRGWEKLKAKLNAGHNAPYWVKKVQANQERDLRNTQRLQSDGWLVLRFWETDIKRSPEAILQNVRSALAGRVPLRR